MSTSVVRPPFLVVAVLLPLCLGVRPVEGQDVRVVSDAPSCTGCRIVVEPVVSLGDRDGPGAITSTFVVDRDPEGRFWVAHGDGSPANAFLTVFDSGGRFLARLGGRGDGPGEFQAIGRLRFLGADTVAVFDSRSRRRTVMTLGGEVVSTRPFDVGRFRYSLDLPDGRMISVDHRVTPERAGYPLQLVDTGGSVVRSFGSVRPDYDPRAAMAMMKVTARGPDGASVWTVGRGDYLMELWDTLGHRRAVLKRSSQWFHSYDLNRAVSPTVPPQPIITDSRSDDEGRLWIAVAVPASGWKEALSEPSPGVFALDEVRAYATVLEVIEPSSGQLIASDRLSDFFMVGFFAGDLVATYREDEAGFPYVDIWRVSLEQPSRPTPDGN